jgi:hypothetical protein
VLIVAAFYAQSTEKILQFLFAYEIFSVIA